MEYKRPRHWQTINCNVTVRFPASLKSFGEMAPFSSVGPLVALLNEAILGGESLKSPGEPLYSVSSLKLT